MYKRSYQIQIKKGHKLYNYFYQMCTNSKNLYNTTNFYIRQVYTAFKNEQNLKEYQQQVLKEIEQFLPQLNNVQHQAYEKRLKRMENTSHVTTIKCNLFDFPSKENAFLSYNFLDCFFKVIKQPDYLALPIQSSQNIMKVVYQDWKGFFEALKSYQKKPTKFTGKPKIPNYKKDLKTVYFTNQDCVIKQNNYLKFPKIKEQLNIGKLGILGKLKQVRVVPKFNIFIIEVVMDIEEPQQKNDAVENRVMAIDLGVTNFATCVTNIPYDKPFILNGNPLKSMNQYYNKKRAILTSQLRKGKQVCEGSFKSKQLARLNKKHFNKMKDFYHKASYFILKEAVKKKIKTIVIGKNEQWKNQIKLRKDVKQNFLFISHNNFIDYLQYKAEEMNMNIVIQEESYTSKASFLDRDEMPNYGDKHIPKFSGKRIKRGLYQTKTKLLINADVNGAYNILRKAIPSSFDGIEVVVVQPLKQNIR